MSKRERGRPQKVEDGAPLHMLLPGKLFEALDAWVAEVQSSVPGGAGITRSDLIRDILERAVADHERSRTAAAKPSQALPAVKKKTAPKRRR